MQLNTYRILCAALALLCSVTAASADVKIKTKTTMAGQSYEGTTYIKKSRQRTEQNFGPMRSVMLLQCDLRRNVQINDAAKLYFIMPFDAAGTQTTGGGAASSAPEPKTTRRGGIITYTTTITDTGERKQMFGLTARHLKVTMSAESSPDACNPSKLKVENDGWYVDLEYGVDCNQGGVGGGMSAGSRPECQDEIRYKTAGAGKLGYPLLLTTKVFDDNGREASVMTTEALEFSQAQLDPGLFEVPAGYTEAKTIQEFYSASSTRAAVTAAEPAAPVSPAATTTAAAAIAGTVTAGTPKQAGAVRIGLVLPQAQTSTIDAGQAAEAVRNTYVGYLNGPSVEVVLLNARAPEQAFAEAKQGLCDFILFTVFTQKKGGGGMFGKVLGNVASTAVSRIPGGGSAGEAIAREAATTVLYNTSMVADAVKAKDEVSLEYKLQSVADRKQVVTNADRAKAKSDGEDVITPMVQRSAEAVVASVRK